MSLLGRGLGAALSILAETSATCIRPSRIASDGRVTEPPMPYPVLVPHD
jgi:hypothetical protein